ncbi:MAG: hypothetical protein GXO87_00660 [Chlorobi bacterium]|nr:hypothetical protein [Chlorobiota bacterium]
MVAASFSLRGALFSRQIIFHKSPLTPRFSAGQAQKQRSKETPKACLPQGMGEIIVITAPKK